MRDSLSLEGGMIRLETLHRAQISQFELCELILLLKLDKQFPVEQFQAAVSQSTVPSPPLRDSLSSDLSREVPQPHTPAMYPDWQSYENRQ